MDPREVYSLKQPSSHMRFASGLTMDTFINDETRCTNDSRSYL